MRIRVCVAVLAGLLGLMLVSGYAQEKKTTYTKGDTVKVRYVGEVVTGKVVSAKLSNFIDVEFDWKGKKIVKTFPLTLVEGVVAPAVTPAPVKPPTPTPKSPTATPKPAAGSKSPAPAKPPMPAAAPGKAPLSPGKGEPEMRTWTSDTGKFTIEARYGGLEDGKVKLLKPDGSTVQVPLEKLCEADRELANQLASSAENPFMESPEGATADPFQEVPDLARPEEPTVAANSPSPSTAPKVVKPTGPAKNSLNSVEPIAVNWSEVGKITSGLVPSTNFKLVPDVGTEAKLEVMDKPYLFGGRSGVRSGKSVGIKRGDKPQSVMIDPVSQQAIVPLFYSWANEDPSLRVVRINLKDGKTTIKVFPTPVRLASFHPATQRFLGHGDRSVRLNGTEANGFGVWSQTGSIFEPLGAWKLDNPELHVNGIPASAQFAGTDFAVVWTEHASVSVWNLVEKKPVYVIETGWESGPPAVSANGKYLGVQSKEGKMLVLDLPTGDVIGSLPQKNLTSIAFHPQGRFLAASSAQRVVVYDLLEGNVHSDVFLNQAIASSVWRKELVWLGDNFLLSGNAHLIDIEHSTVLWHYDFPGWDHELPASTFYGGQYWYAIKSDDGEEAGLFHVDLPHPAALEVAQTIDSSALVLDAGVKLRVDVSAGSTADEKARIKATLVREITAKGMLVDDSSTLVLSASTSTGKTSTETYHFYGGMPDQTVSTTEQICSLRLTQGGQTAWQVQSVTGGSVPFYIRLRPGDSAQDYINSITKPNLQFFYDAEIPARLAKVPEAGAYGFSNVTKNGVEEAAPPQNPKQ